MTFKYSSQVVFSDSIDIEDIGNCAIVAYEFDETAYAMIVRTVAGKTEIYYCGPVNKDGDIENYCSLSYNKFDYSVPKISKAIDKFVKTADIIRVVEVTPQEALDKFVNLAEKYSNQVNTADATNSESDAE